jgi:hypothetical protein
LYAVSNQSRLFTVNTASGALTAIGTGLTPALSGTSFGFDFNPTVDRIRLVSNTGKTYDLHPRFRDSSLCGNLNPGTPFVTTGAAYTNNFAGATTTALFVIGDALFRQDP